MSPAALDQAVAETVSALVDRKRASLVMVKEYLQHAAHMDPEAAARYAAVGLATVLSSKEG